MRNIIKEIADAAEMLSSMQATVYEDGKPLFKAELGLEITLNVEADNQEACAIIHTNHFPYSECIDIPIRKSPPFCITYATYEKLCAVIGGTFIQARAHRKKRINKKWAKRYGYKFTQDTKNVIKW